MKKTGFFRLLSMLMVMTLAVTAISGCTGGKDPAPSGSASTTPSSSSAPATTPPEGKKIRVALLTGSGGLGDRSFNDAAWRGFQKAETELGVEIKVIEPQTVSDYTNAITAAANGGFDFIMTGGNDWVETVNAVAPKYPDTMFGGINIAVTLDNVCVAKFSDFESGFLAGSLAAMVSQTGTVGYIGGMDAPAIQRFYVGYEEGAKYVKSDINVLPTFVGAFNDPGKGKEFALQLISQKADVIYHGAGKSGEGLFDAIKTAPEGYYAIGCDSDQDYIVEGKVLASTLKRVDVAAYDMIKSVQEGTFQSGDKIYNLANGGLGFSDMTYTKDTIVTKDMQDQIADITAKIISGEIKITDVFEQKK